MRLVSGEKRQQILGKIPVGAQPEMVLNQNGMIVREIIESLPYRYPIDIPIYQIMPNHIHLIILINNDRAIHESPLRKRSLLSIIIGYLKMNSAKAIHQVVGAHHDAPVTIWQRNYFEHVIRNEKDLEMISEYIFNNPSIWDRDRNNPQAEADLTPY